MNAFQNPANILVRCDDRMVFPVRATDLEPLACSCYDPWCFRDPLPGRTYMEVSEWNAKRAAPSPAQTEAGK